MWNINDDEVGIVYKNRVNVWRHQIQEIQEYYWNEYILYYAFFGLPDVDATPESDSWVVSDFWLSGDAGLKGDARSLEIEWLKKVNENERKK